MGWTARTAKPLETIGALPGDLWVLIEPSFLNDAQPPLKSHGGRPRIDWRLAINGSLFRRRTGCRWNNLPECFGDAGSIRRWFGR